jgi:hypothetical protein
LLDQFSGAAKFRDHLQGALMFSGALLESQFQILAQQRPVNAGHVSFHDGIAIGFRFHPLV